MTLACLDVETHLIADGRTLPPIVVSATHTDGNARLHLGYRATLDAFFDLLSIPNVTYTNAAASFDLGCLVADAERHNDSDEVIPHVIGLYRDNRVYDPLIALSLQAIYDGTLGDATFDPTSGKGNTRFNLGIATAMATGRVDAKRNDLYKLSYALLENVPLRDWPPEARQYVLDDVTNAMEVTEVQMGLRPGPGIHRWESAPADINDWKDITQRCQKCDVRWNGVDRVSSLRPCVGETRKLENLGNMGAQARADFSLRLGAAWGLRTDASRIEVVEARATKANAAMIDRFAKYGWFDIAADGTAKKNNGAVKRAILLAYGADVNSKCPTCAGTGKVPKPKGKGFNQCKVCGTTGLDVDTAPSCPRTPTDGIKTDRDTLAESGDDVLAEFGDNEEMKTTGTYLPFLKKGLIHPITLSHNVLLANGRTSYDGVIQLLPQKLDIRECIRARAHHYLFSIDASGFELCTFAQFCLWTVGFSKAAEIINATGDPGALHAALAGKMLGIPFDEIRALVKAKAKKAKDTRQAAKHCNFGFLGGLGALKFILMNRVKSKGYTWSPDGKVRYNGIRFCILVGGAERCGVEKLTTWHRNPCPPVCKACIMLAQDFLKPAWLEMYPEAKEYFKIVATWVESGGRVPCLTPTVEGGIERWRGGVSFTDGANNGFSALASTAIKHAMWKVTEEAMTDRSSPMYGRVHPITLIHDEIFGEAEAETAHLSVPRASTVMIAAIREHTPDVTIVADPALMRHMSKSAEPAYKDGKLIPWEDLAA